MNSEEKKNREEIKKEILALPANPHGRLILSPRLGKTSLVISLIKRDKPKSILWVTPLAELAEFGIKDEFKLWKAIKFLPALTTTTWASLHNITGKYDLIVLDEEQHITENNSVNLLNGTLSYGNIISMTGTPTKSFEKNILYSKLNLDILYYIPINTASEMEILSDYEINVLKFPLSTKKDTPVQTKTTTFYTSELAQYNYYSSQLNTKMGALWRMRVIAKSETKKRVVKNLLKTLQGKKLIFAPYIDIAEQISKNVYHGKSPNNKAFLDFLTQKSDELCLVNKGGTGVTYTNVHNLIIMQADSDTNGLTTQKIMRCLLKDGVKPTIWILCHENTQDEVWVNQVLKNFNSNKIKIINTHGN